MHKAFIAIGSNIGNRHCHLQEAIDCLERADSTSVSGLSAVYMTEPVGETDQERFYNAVVLLETALSAEELRRQCKKIEQELGRPEAYRRWSPRVIDLDILLYDNLSMSTPELTIPHPELPERKFVLIPLLDIANPVHPVLQRSILELLERCPDRSVLIMLKEPLRHKKKRAAR
ncbi:MAG: 2-amino-4-hydroxy-6-hydroxymethyldihydropteridine diphosphokinase [Chlorobiaceae bacterium]